MSDLEKLQLINLKAKVTRELETHLGVSDEVLVNFLISEARRASNEDDFFSKMNGMDETFSMELANSIFFLVSSLLDQAEPESEKIEKSGEALVPIEEENNNESEFLEKNPNLKTEKKETGDEKIKSTQKTVEKKKKFPGLSFENSNNHQIKLGIKNEEALDLESSSQTDADSDSENEREKKKKKKRKKSRKSKKRRSSFDSDRKKKKKKSKKSKKLSKSKKSKLKASKRYLEDQKLKKGLVFRGRVKRILNFGAVIAFMTLRGRREGLVHISNLKNFRVRSVSEILREGETVYVKVLDIDGRKVSLSMKELDQRTGEDVVRGDESKRSERMRRFVSEKAVEVGESRKSDINKGAITGVRLDLDKKVKKRMDKNEGNELDAWERTRYVLNFLIFWE